MILIRLLAITLVFLLFGSVVNGEEKKLKFRGNASKDTNTENIVIKISPEMLVLDEFKELGNQYESLKNYAKEIDKFAKPRKKLKFRGNAQNIYSQYADSVVYIANYKGKSVGAGFLIDRAGIILTNWHVVEGAKEVAVWIKPKDGSLNEEVLFEDIDPYLGYVAAIAILPDLALIKVGGFPKNIKVVSNFGSIKDIGMGDQVYAIGHPEGLPWTFTIGNVSQIRPNHKWTYEDGSKHEADLIQTQTPISPGNSGGPLFDGDGKLLGINTLQAGGQNLNFAVAVEHARNFINKNPAIKKINPGSELMKKDFPNAKTQDYNKNGIIDTWYTDDDKNGEIDTAYLDDNEDGKIEAILIDDNENGVWEIQIIDEDQDGKPEKALLDRDEDGKLDTVAYDTNQDGEWDKFEKITS